MKSKKRLIQYHALILGFLIILAIVIPASLISQTHSSQVSPGKTPTEQKTADSRGFKGEVIAHVTGSEGSSFTYHYYFDNIQISYTDSWEGYTFLKTSSGRASVAGKSSCTRGTFCIRHYQNTYNYDAYHNKPGPALHLELKEDSKTGEVFYEFWTGIYEEYPIHYTVTKSGTCGQSGPKSHVKTVWAFPKIWIGNISDPETKRRVYAAAEDGVVYLERINDPRQYSIAKGDKCIQGTQMYQAEYGGAAQQFCPMNIQVKWFIYLGEEDFDIEVDKCDRSWRPKKDGETAAVSARITGSEGVTGIFRFTLYDVSAEPGFCMNDGKQDDDDLEFLYSDAIFHTPTREVNNDGQEVQIMDTKEPMRGCTALVKPHDYGAYGKVKVEVNICGMWYVAHVRGGEKDHIDIPLDDDGNHIADGCKQNSGRAEDDLDSQPQGDGTPGDGFSNYEEYRGFMLDDGEWHDTSIDVKDFFVNFSSGLDFYSFPELSELRCHRLSYLQMDSNRVVNFNHDTAHILDQHGVRVEKGTISDLGDVEAAGHTDSSVWPAYPGSVTNVIIDTSKGEAEEVVPHELGHCVGIVHHGEDYDWISKSTDPHLPWDEFFPNQEVNPGTRFYCAMWGGLHSGHENCIMRYDDAMFYEREDGQVYRYWCQPVVKNVLCSEPDGTGDNAPPERRRTFTAGDFSWIQVLPKCGPATVGACKGQIRVKDKK